MFQPERRNVFSEGNNAHSDEEDDVYDSPHTRRRGASVDDFLRGSELSRHVRPRKRRPSDVSHADAVHCHLETLSTLQHYLNYDTTVYSVAEGCNVMGAAILDIQTQDVRTC